MEIGRELLAYGIMTTGGIIALPVFIASHRRRRIEKLRRRGIKKYGH